MALIQIAIAVDQLANSMLGGMADETLSARAFRVELQGRMAWPRRLIDALFRWSSWHHCYHAWHGEIKRRQLPSHYHMEGARRA